MYSKIYSHTPIVISDNKITYEDFRIKFKGFIDILKNIPIKMNSGADPDNKERLKIMKRVYEEALKIESIGNDYLDEDSIVYFTKGNYIEIPLKNLILSGLNHLLFIYTQEDKNEIIEKLLFKIEYKISSTTKEAELHLENGIAIGNHFMGSKDLLRYIYLKDKLPTKAKELENYHNSELINTINEKIIPNITISKVYKIDEAIFYAIFSYIFLNNPIHIFIEHDYKGRTPVFIDQTNLNRILETGKCGNIITLNGDYDIQNILKGLKDLHIIKAINKEITKLLKTKTIKDNKENTQRDKLFESIRKQVNEIQGSELKVSISFTGKTPKKTETSRSDYNINNFVKNKEYLAGYGNIEQVVHMDKTIKLKMKKKSRI